MADKERLVLTEEKVIVPEVKLGAKVVFADLWRADHALLDQLATEVLAKYRYDQPMSMLADLTRSPVTVSLRQNGLAGVSFPALLGTKETYGDCLTLCYKVMEDSDFQTWISELSIVSDTKVDPYLAHGTSPNYFLAEGMRHFWLILRHASSRTHLVVDPAFQRISLGDGYRFEPSTAQMVGTFPIPRAGNIRHKAVKYGMLANGMLFFEPGLECGFSVLGIGKNKKIVEVGFARGETKLDPVLPLARLIDLSGKTMTFYQDPLKGIVTQLSKENPLTSDLTILSEFFEIAKKFEFRFTND